VLAVDAREHQAGCDADGVGARDVGVEPVPDEQGGAGAGAAQGLLHQGPEGLAGDDGGLAGGDLDGVDRHARAGHQAPLGGPGGVGVAGVPARTVLNGDRGLVQPAPGHVGVVALHDGVRGVGGRVDDREPGLDHVVDEVLGAGDQHLGARGQFAGHEPHGRLSAGDEVVDGGPEPERHQVVGHRLRRTGRVVGDVDRPDAARLERRHPLDGPVDRQGAQIDHPVQVEERDVVRVDQATHHRSLSSPASPVSSTPYSPASSFHGTSGPPDDTSYHSCSDASAASRSA